MASADDEVVKELEPMFRLYKSGRVERFYEQLGPFFATTVQPSPETPSNGVFSKDVTISTHVSARLYLPQNTKAGQKLPVFVYYHGGGLCMESAFCFGVHCYVNHLAYELNVVAVSVDYRLAPEVDVPTIYEDCWVALQWITSHSGRENPNNVAKDLWLTEHGDFDKLFIAGDSAGGNLAYHMTMWAGKHNLKITGSILAYPYFLFPNMCIDENGWAYRIWAHLCPPQESGRSIIESPLINPLSEQGASLVGLGCSRLLLCMGTKDDIIPLSIGNRFVKGLNESGWNGEFEYVEVDGGHSFQMYEDEFGSEEAKRLMKCYADFVHR